jgi:enterochelin esterase-like enzyme
MQRRQYLVFLAVALFAVATAFAQPAPGRGGFGPPVRSPEVAADSRVTFRLRAPNAKEIFVTGLPPGQRLAMQKDEQGVWSVTTDPLKPDMYGYMFNVDGANFNDPGNSNFKTAAFGAGQSQVHVPGPVSWEPAPGIARGAVAHHFYHSALIGDDRDFYVYTPPNYDPARKEAYPVLYLLHGLGDDAYGWISAGAANIILDNLIAQGKAKPMIMVNTLGYGIANMMQDGRGGRGGAPGVVGGDKMIPNFAQALVTEVMPLVEKQYRVSKNRTERAVAGLSMGGAEALYTGLNNMDKFAWVASFSGAFVMWPGAVNTASPVNPAAAPAPGGGRGGPMTLDAAVFERNFPALSAEANSQLKMLWIGCGTEDGLIGVNRQFKTWLKGKDVRFTDVEIPAMAHVWPLWRQNLTEIAPMLFQVGLFGAK